MDLGVILLEKLMQLLIIGREYLLGKCFSGFKRRPRLKKIERKDLASKKTTTDDNALGYSITQKRVIPMSELDKRKHTLICGASGFGKTVLLDTLMYDDMRKGKPVIFIDPKGDNRSLNQFINLCRLVGREFKVFSEYYEGVGAIALNPAKDGSFTHIADRIHHSFSWSEEHYETLCYRALKRACQIIIKAKKGAVSYESLLGTLLAISSPDAQEREFERKNIEGIIARLET